MNISGLIITYNEEKNIAKCIDSLRLVCDEIIVIDSFSKDGTAAIAKAEGAIVVLQEFLGDGPQRIFGVPYCKNDWILNLDADEFLDTDSIEFIKNKWDYGAKWDAYSFKVKNFLQDELINFAGWYPDRKIRFFNKKTASPSSDIVHQRVICQHLKQENVHLLHYGSNSLHQIIEKKNTYAVWSAKKLYDSGVRVSYLKPAVNGLVSFLRCYFFKSGIFHGINGLTLSLTQGYFSYLKYANLLFLQNGKKIH
jgi:glycosyltransferase involved in cell wall biosynthesis